MFCNKNVARNVTKFSDCGALSMQVALRFNNQSEHNYSHREIVIGRKAMYEEDRQLRSRGDRVCRNAFKQHWHIALPISLTADLSYCGEVKGKYDYFIVVNVDWGEHYTWLGVGTAADPA